MIHCYVYSVASWYNMVFYGLFYFSMVSVPEGRAGPAHHPAESSGLRGRSASIRFSFGSIGFRDYLPRVSHCSSFFWLTSFLVRIL